MLVCVTNQAQGRSVNGEADLNDKALIVGLAQELARLHEGSRRYRRERPTEYDQFEPWDTAMEGFLKTLKPPDLEKTE